MASFFRHSYDDNPKVFFDLETTGLIQDGILPDIIQIGAIHEDDVFDRYVLPEKPMTASAFRLTGLRVEGNTLLRHGMRVPTVQLHEAMRDFLDWLENIAVSAGGKKPVLLAYNGTKFDVPILRNAFRNCGLESEARRGIGGVADPFTMVKIMIPKHEIPNYRLETLAREYCGGIVDSHNAVGDCKALKGVYFARLDPVVSLDNFTTAF